MDGLLEGEPGEPAASPEVEAVGIDAGGPPALAREPEEMACHQAKRLAMVRVQMRQDVRLGRGESRGRGPGEEGRPLEPMNAAEAGHQVSPLRGHAIKAEVLEA